MNYFPDLSTVVCVGSGPSLVEDDCEMVRRSGLPVIAINNTWTRFPDCYGLYAGDYKWWHLNNSNVPRDKFRLMTASGKAAREFGIEKHRFVGPKDDYTSGSMAIEFAAKIGASNIILLGYDCSVTHGTHWHGDHPEGLHNPTKASMTKWLRDFVRVRNKYPQLNIINCSRRTALSCFPLRNLDQVLAASLLHPALPLKTS